jgi:hypothetical protein
MKKAPVEPGVFPARSSSKGIRYREQVVTRRKAQQDIEAQLAQIEAELCRQKSALEAQEVAAD